MSFQLASVMDDLFCNFHTFLTLHMFVCHIVYQYCSPPSILPLLILPSVYVLVDVVSSLQQSDTPVFHSLIICL